MTASQSRPVLTVDEIDTHYGASHVLKNVSLTVRPNETVTILGRNGVGKTTTLRSIMGLTPPTTGKVTLNGEKIHGLEPYQVRRRGISWVPEGRRVFSGLTVEENLRIAASQGESTDFESVFDQFPVLAERRNQSAETMSGGEQQMLAIARGLIGPQTELLLLDEPSEGLAPQIQEDVKDIVNGLTERGIPILLVEQNPDIAITLADRVYIMETGRIKYEEDADNIDATGRVVEQYLGVK
jgi:branched-chain amino acid transport system ATP-binding protein